MLKDVAGKRDHARKKAVKKKLVRMRRNNKEKFLKRKDKLTNKRRADINQKTKMQMRKVRFCDYWWNTLELKTSKTTTK